MYSVVCRCPGSQVAIQALASRKVDTAYRVFCALLEAADGSQDGGSQPQAMDNDDPVSACLQIDLARYCSDSLLDLINPEHQCLNLVQHLPVIHTRKFKSFTYVVGLHLCLLNHNVCTVALVSQCMHGHASPCCILSEMLCDAVCRAALET